MGYRDERVQSLDDAERRNSHPLIATIIGSLFLIFVAGAPEGTGPTDASETLAYAIGTGIGAVIVVGGIAWFATVRHASTAWKVACLSTLFVFGVLVALVKAGEAQTRTNDGLRESAGQLEKVLRAADPAKAHVAEGTSPMSKMSATLFNGMIADGAAFDQEAASAGMWQVISLKGLSKTSPVLDHCDRVSGMAGRAHYYESHLATHLQSARKVGESFVQTGEMQQGVVDGFLAGARDNASIGKKWELLAAMSQEAGGLCGQLAQRKWIFARGMVRFASGAELKAANTRLNRVKQLQSELQQMQASARTDAQAEIERLKRL